MEECDLKFEPDLVDFVLQFGPEICNSLETCRSTLVSVGISKVTPPAVARIMNGMLKALESTGPSNKNQQQEQGIIDWGRPADSSGDSSGNDPGGGGSEQQWNLKVFVQAIIDLIPGFIWKEVFHQLDYPGFNVKSTACFRALLDALKYGLILQGQTRPDQFPVEAFYRVWNNSDAQVGLIKHCLNPGNYDVFCFADFPYHPVPVDILKNSGADKGYDGKEISTWKSLQLVELCLRLADLGHYPTMLELFQFPLTNCPDILILGLSQLNIPMNVLRTDLLTSLFPIFLGPHVSSGVILQHAWHVGPSSIRPVIISAMANWYLQSDYDQTRLSRILDIAQDLKALPLLLNANSHGFIIDLACLASRREFLKLDKWLGDKIRDHGEGFVGSLVKVISRRVPQLVAGKSSGSLSDLDSSGGVSGVGGSNKGQQLPPEVTNIIITCLAQCVGKVSSELSETIVSLSSAYNVLMLNKSRGTGLQQQQPQSQPPLQQQQPTNNTGVPGILRHRSMDPSSSPFPSSIQSPTNTHNPNQLFSNPIQQSSNNPDPMSNLSSTITGLNLAGAGSFGGMNLNPPGSPSRLLGPNFGGGPGPQPPPQQSSSVPPFPGLGSLQLGGGGVPPVVPSSNRQTSSTPPTLGMGNPNLIGMLGGSGRESGGGSNRFGLGNPGPQQAQQAQVPNSSSLPPQLQNRDLAAYMADSRQLFTDIQAHEITKEAEDEANSYFHRIYSKPPDPSMSIDEVLELLKKFQDSAIRREREVFVCMLRNLFEEYKFFPQYPDKELHTTAQLFGGIIEHGLVTTYLQLGVALRFVVDAIKKPPGTKMYYFGIAALDKFKTKLKDYPQYSQHLTTIPHFNDFPPPLQEFIEYGARSQEPPAQVLPRKSNSNPLPNLGPASLPPAATTSSPSSGPAILQTTTNAAGTIGPKIAKNPGGGGGAHLPLGRPSIVANSTNINTLLVATEREDKIQPPPEAIQDKTAFIFNNLNQMNLVEKCKELKELLGENYWLWMSQYLVMKRASIELNFHTLYANLLDAISHRPLYVAVVKETHRNIQILLRTDKSASNFSDRSLLKNLGHWLGMITLMKNRPINMDDLDIKSLIVEAYRKGMHDLLYVVPFAAKIMESCARSQVFKPPCPWTMAILSVLAELHKEPEMKLNLKFEIEVLCKALSLEIYELKASSILKEDSDSAFKIHIRQLSYGTSASAAAAAAARTATTSESSDGKGKADGRSSASGTPNPEEGFGALGTRPIPTPPLPIPLPGAAGQSMSAPNLLQTAGQIGGPVLHGLSSANISGVATEPKFSYLEIDTSNLQALLGHVVVNHSLPLFQSYPNLKQYIRTAVEKTIHDLLLPVVDRSIKYTINACESVIKKDFALDPDENRLRIAAHGMMRFLTAGMAMITSRDHIFISIKSNLSQVFTNAVRSTPGPTGAQQLKDLIESACSSIAQDNVEIPCVFIQKTAVEKGQQEIDKRLTGEMEMRKQAKIEGRRWMDTNMLSYQSERVAEQLRVKPGNMMALVPVYEDFARGIPGFLTPTDAEIPFINPLSKYVAASAGGRLVDMATMGSGTGTGVSSQPQQQQLQQQQGNVSQSTPGPGANDELISIYEKLITQMENYMLDLGNSQTPISGHLNVGVSLLADLIMKAKMSRSVVNAITLLQKAVEGLLEGISTFPSEPEIIRFRDAHLMVLKALQDPRAFGEQWVNRQVTKTLIETRNELKYNVEAVDTLIRSNLVNLLQFDAFLSNALEKGNNIPAMNFAIPLVRMYCVDERFGMGGSSAVNEGDFCHTADILSRCATMNRSHPEGLLSLVEALRGGGGGPGAGPGQQQQQQQQQSADSGNQGGGPPFDFTNRIITPNQAQQPHLPPMPQPQREFDDPSGIVEKSELLLREWIRLYMREGTVKDSSKPFASFINELNLSGILKSDDSISRFFRISVQCCVTQVYQGLQNSQLAMARSKLYQASDALTRLVALLVRHIGDTGNTSPKVSLLTKFLGIVAGLLIQDHNMQKGEFQQMPFHRMFIMLFYDLIGTDPIYENMTMATLTGFSNTMHILNPTKVPGFAFAWLEIVGNRQFIARMLALASEQKCWAMYCQLLLDLFKFLQPFMRNADMPSPVGKLYRGSLRVLLVILHDFPDFLCDYCYHFLDAIPPNCIQMRNLVLSAFPRNMRLPDPFTANLKFEMLADTSVAPRILSNVAGSITPASFKKELDSYLKTRAPVTFLSELRTNLQTQSDESSDGNRYNIPLLNALVLYVGSQHIGGIRARGQSPSLSTVAHTSHMDIFQNLAVDLDTEGRYLFLNALANQLRFPSSHTHYFSLIILYLFAQSNTEVVQEQITRVLLERLVVNRPHPWGLLVTFIELIKNQQYKFWNHEFVHCAPEVEKLFESVARSCMVTKTPPTGLSSGTLASNPSGTNLGINGPPNQMINFQNPPQQSSSMESGSGGGGGSGTGSILDAE